MCYLHKKQNLIFIPQCLQSEKGVHLFWSCFCLDCVSAIFFCQKIRVEREREKTLKVLFFKYQISSFCQYFLLIIWLCNSIMTTPLAWISPIMFPLNSQVNRFGSFLPSHRHPISSMGEIISFLQKKSSVPRLYCYSAEMNV